MEMLWTRHFSYIKRTHDLRQFVEFRMEKIVLNLNLLDIVYTKFILNFKNSILNPFYFI